MGISFFEQIFEKWKNRGTFAEKIVLFPRKNLFGDCNFKENAI